MKEHKIRYKVLEASSLADLVKIREWVIKKRNYFYDLKIESMGSIKKRAKETYPLYCDLTNTIDEMIVEILFEEIK